MLKLLYIGDIVSEAGRSVVARILPGLVREHRIDGVIAQAENVTGGKGMSLEDFRSLKDLGIDAFTGGNWSAHRPELIPCLNDQKRPVGGPANFGADNRPGYKYVNLKNSQTILIVSLLGRTMGGKLQGVEHPLLVVDRILAERQKDVAATVVNFHGDLSSEKKIIGYYLDGRASLVVGDHWHVPSADAMILPKGTAHITDVGMCGSLHSSLGQDINLAISRWQTGDASRQEWDENKPWQFNAVLVTVNQSGLADSCESIQKRLA